MLRSSSMMSLKVVVCAAVACMVLVDWSTSLPTAQVGDIETFTKQLEMVGANNEDEHQRRWQQAERDFLNDLVGRAFVKRLRTLTDVEDFQRKRNYWRQCAFNAVACFGKKK